MARSASSNGNFGHFLTVTVAAGKRLLRGEPPFERTGVKDRFRRDRANLPVQMSWEGSECGWITLGGCRFLG
jgi:hypothetical protein